MVLFIMCLVRKSISVQSQKHGLGINADEIRASLQTQDYVFKEFTRDADVCCGTGILYHDSFSVERREAAEKASFGFSDWIYVYISTFKRMQLISHLTHQYI